MAHVDVSQGIVIRFAGEEETELSDVETTKDDREVHRHEWTIDYSQPTFDSEPVHYALECNCGATACGQSPDDVHRITLPAATKDEPRET